MEEVNKAFNETDTKPAEDKAEKSTEKEDAVNQPPKKRKKSQKPISENEKMQAEILSSFGFSANNTK